MKALDYIDELASVGRYDFTTDEAHQGMGLPLASTRVALCRLAKTGRIATPMKGFHVVVPPVYRRYGCLPPQAFIPSLMNHLALPYYVALLSAAQYHGAAHHRPMLFQVITPGTRRPISCGKTRVDFIMRRDMAKMPTQSFTTDWGYLLVSSPELTALEMVGYVDHCVGFDHVATVLVELVEALRPKLLVAAAKLCPWSWSQRLGYLLELVGAEHLAAPLAGLIKTQDLGWTKLVSAKTDVDAQRSPRFRLFVNTVVEPEL